MEARMEGYRSNSSVAVAMSRRALANTNTSMNADVDTANQPIENTVTMKAYSPGVERAIAGTRLGALSGGCTRAFQRQCRRTSSKTVARRSRGFFRPTTAGRDPAHSSAPRLDGVLRPVQAALFAEPARSPRR